MPSDWIFFDCFNTLLDEPANDQSGLCSIPSKLVQWGFFKNERHFLQTYHTAIRTLGPDWTEVTLPQRLAYCLNTATPSNTISAELALQQLMNDWHQEYPQTLCPTPGVIDMLHHWRTRARLAVISNFYLPGLPAQYLQSHNMAHFFDFILDSATLGHKKPGHRIYQHALAQAGLAPSDASRVLFIGDRIDLDINPPRALGMQVMHFDRTSHTPATNNVRTIQSWDEFR
jgi:putative hydrolase of the HAD superfamily